MTKVRHAEEATGPRQFSDSRTRKSPHWYDSTTVRQCDSATGCAETPAADCVRAAVRPQCQSKECVRLKPEILGLATWPVSHVSAVVRALGSAADIRAWRARHLSLPESLQKCQNPSSFRRQARRSRVLLGGHRAQRLLALERPSKLQAAAAQRKAARRCDSS